MTRAPAAEARPPDHAATDGPKPRETIPASASPKRGPPPTAAILRPESRPLRWSGVFIKKEEACRKFVFSGKVQLHHINGLTYDFLYGMAKELGEANSLMVLGAGPKSGPLILRRGGTPYRGFLEGRIEVESSKKKLVVIIDDKPTGAPYIDECLEKLGQAKRRASAQTWVQRFSGIKNAKL